MTDINDIIKREVNPFDIEMKHLEFWADEKDSLLMVESIHKNAIIEIEELLDLVGQDHRSRTVLLEGESGSGKTYLLRRIKRSFNSKAFFAYILCDWPDSTHIWRHILRRTVDSLIQVPEGEKESQLILWLKSLTAFTKRDIKQRIFNDNFWEALQSNRQKFIKHLKDSYKKAGIYNPDMFFGVLHDLTNPELYDLACEWLRGDDLNEDSMKEIKVKTCIDTEDAAKNILANFGRISTQTQPIVLCFDNLETMPQLPEGLLDIQPFLNVNTTIHGNNLKNFLVIISVITNNWNRHLDRIFLADKVGIHRKTRLKDITLEQAEALWTYHLKPLHQLANPRPESSIFPLNREMLEKNNPGSKTKPRNALTLGREEYQKYKGSLLDEDEKPKPDPVTIKIKVTIPDKETIPKPIIILPPPPVNNQDPTQAEFELLWQHEYTKSQGKITKISLLSSPDLIQMLQQSISSLKMQGVKTKLLSGKYASYSLSYQHPTKREKLGIVWTEDSNMTSFYHIMNACQTVLQKNLCQTMYLIRSGDLGKPNMAGNQLYRQIFTDTNHVHIKPSLQSIHYLATYQSLVNFAKSQELVIRKETINLQRLETLINESEILNQCTLLQDLGIVSKPNPKPNGKEGEDLRPVKNFLLNLVKTQGYMGVATLISQAVSQFPDVKETEIRSLIEQLYQEKKVKTVNPEAKLSEQLICLIP